MCPLCEANTDQVVLGCLGLKAVIRCRYCGATYNVPASEVYELLEDEEDDDFYDEEEDYDYER